MQCVFIMHLLVCIKGTHLSISVQQSFEPCSSLQITNKNRAINRNPLCIYAHGDGCFYGTSFRALSCQWNAWNTAWGQSHTASAFPTCPCYWFLGTCCTAYALGVQGTNSTGVTMWVQSLHLENWRSCSVTAPQRCFFDPTKIRDIFQKFRLH